MWWFLPYIDVNQPWVQYIPPSWTSLPPPYLPYPSGLSQSTSLGYSTSCIELALVIYFIYGKYTCFNAILLDVRAIWLRHLSPHWSPGLIRLIWLVRQVSSYSLTAPFASLPKLWAQSKRMTIPDRRGPVFRQGYTSSCAPLLEPPNNLSKLFSQIIPPSPSSTQNKSLFFTSVSLLLPWI